MPLSNRPIRLLIIEDNQEHAELLERLLGFSEFPKFSVAISGTLADGLKKLAGGLEDVVLLDLTLPDSKGVETFRAVNTAVPTLPIVVLSGIADVTTAIEMVQEGAQDYLVKGHVDTHLLMRSIQYAVERKRAQVAVQNSNAQLESRVNERTAELTAANDRLQQEVSERKYAEEQLVRTNRQLTVALGDLRTAQRPQPSSDRPAAPVRELDDVFKRIQQNGELILRVPATMANPAKVTEHLQVILTAVETGRRALRRTREMTEVSVESVETVEADVLVDSVMAVMKPKVREQGKAEGPKVSLVKQVDKGVKIEGDPVRLREMLAQLVANSISAIPRRGKVMLGAKAQGGEVVLFVQDDGLGITEAARQRLLNPSTGDDRKGDRTTGYALIHEVVARHRGRLEIESRKGIGTTVRVIFGTAKSEDATVARRRVLVVDDEAMIREVITAYLSEDGYVVEEAVNGRDALEKFCAGDFHMVLTDLEMPEMEGDELARELKKRKPSVPVILLTGHGGAMIAGREKPEGVDLVLGKPFTMAGLQTALAKFR